MADRKERRDLNSAEYEAREAEKRKKIQQLRKRRKRNQRIFTVLFLLVLIICSIVIFLRTPLFDISEIKIKGNKNVESQVILDVLRVSKGDNIFNYSNSNMEKKIITLPYVSKVEVQKKLPAALFINITEEEEFALLDFNDKMIYTDKNGKSIRERKSGEDKIVPVFTGCKEGTFKIGEYVSLDTEKNTDLFIRMISCIDIYDLENITRVNIEDESDISFYIAETLEVRVGSLGTDDELSYKMAYIKEVIDSLPKNVSGIIDASNIEAGVSYRTREYEKKQVEESAVEEGTEGITAFENSQDGSSREGEENTEEFLE